MGLHWTIALVRRGLETGATSVSLIRRWLNRARLGRQRAEQLISEHK